jgi:hypothetical protein
VYVQDTTNPLVTPGNIFSSITCIIGPALGFQTATQSLEISTASPEALTYRGVFTTAVTGPPAIAAPVVTKQDGTVLVVDTDYALVVDSSGPGGTANAVTTINRISSSSTVADGDIVTIFYHFADSSYYQPQVVENYDAVTASYGLPLLTQPPANPNTSQVDSPLSLGAKVAFENGAGRLILLALNPSDGDLRTQFQVAYNKVITNYSATIIVPVFPDDLTVSSGTVAALTTGLAQDLATHCENATADGYGRIGFFGPPRNYSESDLSVDNLAAAIFSKRVVLTYPFQLQLFNGLTNQTTTVGGCFLAAALGGLLSSLNPQFGLTKRTVSSFVGFNAPQQQMMTRLFKDGLSSNGVCVAEISRQGQIVVRHGVTTDMTGVNTREISMVRIADTLFQLVQIGMESAQLIGQPLDADMVMRVKAALVSILEQAVLQAVIVSYTNVGVLQQTLASGDPTVINCKFSYAPAVPLNYITVAFQVDLTSGDVTTTTGVLANA